MHDIKALRLDPEAYDRAWRARGLEAQTARILEVDAALRAAQTALQVAQSRRNEVSKLIGQAMAVQRQSRSAPATTQLLTSMTSPVRDIATLTSESENLKRMIEHETAQENLAKTNLHNILASLPNLAAAEVPPGEDETGNVEVRRWSKPASGAPNRDHVDLGDGLGLMDFEAAARIAGSRFVVLEGQLARLQRALGQFMIDMQTEEGGYTEVAVPLLVREQAMFGTGQLPKFAEESFQTTDGRWLIPTAEVSLTNLVAGRIVNEEELPIRLTALTPCFRSEAGASGRDTRGMIRQHQFDKVEMVSITTPEQSDVEHERMVGCAEAILKRLELPFRTMLLCDGDMGFSARKTYDLEVWLPSQNTYREISSCSNCGDFQARRMDARCKRPGDKGTRFVHTLNGSGLAVGRALVAIMETYQDEGGAISIPQALHPYLRGLTRIEPAGKRAAA